MACRLLLEEMMEAASFSRSLKLTEVRPCEPGVGVWESPFERCVFEVDLGFPVRGGLSMELKKKTK